MKKEDLLDRFINVLNTKASSKKELAYQIADILNIEIESAYRRLNRQIQFKVPEMELLAKKMNISLDALLTHRREEVPILFKMNLNSTSSTMDFLIKTLEEFVLSQKIMNEEDLEAGVLCDSLPVEFFMFYPHLSKFMYFKWGHYYVKSREFDNFSTWKLPEGLIQAHTRLKKYYENYKHVLYIWDNAVIWNLVNEINYHQYINGLTPEEAANIKKELKHLLKSMEEICNGNNKENPYNTMFELYITNFNVGIGGYYIRSEDRYIAGLSTPFLQPVVHHDYKVGSHIHQWINSLKKISFLISGSGEKERKIFFKQQCSIVDRV